MAEVLSQSQIDALLNAVRSGEKDLNEPAEEQQEKKYRKYDFSSPRKFTKDRIKMLNGIFENYARIINSRLNARLRFNGEITVESIEEQRYYEFSNALTEGDVSGACERICEGEGGGHTGNVLSLHHHRLEHDGPAAGRRWSGG
ncbi:MAG: hypothetical protein V8R75_14195 [Oscillospiraceae bacterium]